MTQARNFRKHQRKAALGREYRKMYKNLNGIRTMVRPPECMVVIDPKKEHLAIHEANRLGIPVVAVAHSCITSWFRAVRGDEPSPSRTTRPVPSGM